MSDNPSTREKIEDLQGKDRPPIGTTWTLTGRPMQLALAMMKESLEAAKKHHHSEDPELQGHPEYCAAVMICSLIKGAGPPPSDLVDCSVLCEFGFEVWENLVRAIPEVNKHVPVESLTIEVRQDFIKVTAKGSRDMEEAS